LLCRDHLSAFGRLMLVKRDLLSAFGRMMLGCLTIHLIEEIIIGF
jgi:hypothetical protein